jgi:hypothetical protein
VVVKEFWVFFDKSRALSSLASWLRSRLALLRENNSLRADLRRSRLRAVCTHPPRVTTIGRIVRACRLTCVHNEHIERPPTRASDQQRDSRDLIERVCTDQRTTVRLVVQIARVPFSASTTWHAIMSWLLHIGG